MIQVIIFINECGIAYIFNTVYIAEQNVSNLQFVIFRRFKRCNISHTFKINLMPRNSFYTRYF